MFYKTSPVAASEGFRFSACNFIEEETPEKLFCCEFCKNFKNIFSFDRTPPDNCFLCLSVNFETFFRKLLYRALGENAILCTSCRISTTGHSKNLFHRCLPSILCKIEKQPFEGVHLLRIPANCL